jgi:hypothetical protein
MSTMSHSSPTEGDLSARRREDLGRDLELLLERLAESREAIVRLLAAGSGGEETLAAEAPENDGTVAEEAWRDDETAEEVSQVDDGIQYTELQRVGPLVPLRSPISPAEIKSAGPVEPEPGSSEIGAAEPLEPQFDGDVTPHQLPSSLRRPGPPALELALIYREIARKDGEVQPEAAPAAAAYHSEPGPKPLAEPPGTAAGPQASGGMPLVEIPALRRAPVPAKPLRVKKTDNGPRAANAQRAARRRLLAVVLMAVGAVVLLTTIVSLLPSIVSAL